MFSIQTHQTDLTPAQWPDYLFTSLASLAIKNPSVPSCILTWFPGLIRMLGNQRHRHISLINFWTTLHSCTQHANQEEWYTHLFKSSIRSRLCFSGLDFCITLNTWSQFRFWELGLLCSVCHTCSSDCIIYHLTEFTDHTLKSNSFLQKRDREVQSSKRKRAKIIKIMALEHSNTVI